MSIKVFEKQFLGVNPKLMWTQGVSISNVLIKINLVVVKLLEVPGVVDIPRCWLFSY